MSGAFGFRLLSDGRAVDAVDPRDRGLAYGDGVFETLRVHAGVVVWWDAHWCRLALGAQRLGIDLPDPSSVRAEAAALAATAGQGVLKLLLTRGAGGRGYAPPDPQRPLLALSTHPLPPGPPDDGLVLRWCDTRLAIQPALAGIKHCNRLEQVLARAEWCDPAVHDGIMRDTDGNAVCATAANLFALIDGGWATPPVDRCGVAGICRGWLLAHGHARQRRLGVAELEAADALFLCNAVRGILPVARLGRRHWPDMSPAYSLITALADAEPAFAQR